MNKPFSMIVKETKAKLVEVCNESGLTPIVLDLIVQGLYSEIHSLAERQTLDEQKVYENTTKNIDLNIEGDVNETE